jgi:hypothetical protein
LNRSFGYNGEVPASFSLALSGGFDALIVRRLAPSRLAAQRDARLLIPIGALLCDCLCEGYRKGMALSRECELLHARKAKFDLFLRASRLYSQAVTGARFSVPVKADGKKRLCS